MRNKKAESTWWGKLHNVTKRTQGAEKRKKITNVTQGDALRSRLGGKDGEKAGEDRICLRQINECVLFVRLFVQL